jgi:hypothetical protein
VGYLGLIFNKLAPVLRVASLGAFTANNTLSILLGGCGHSQLDFPRFPP